MLGNGILLLLLLSSDLSQPYDKREFNLVKFTVLSLPEKLPGPNFGKYTSSSPIIFFRGRFLLNLLGVDNSLGILATIHRRNRSPQEGVSWRSNSQCHFGGHSLKFIALFAKLFCTWNQLQLLLMENIGLTSWSGSTKTEYLHGV